MLALIATGPSNDEISRKIYISPATVKTHASRAMTKLGARDRAQLVVFAYQAGLVRRAEQTDQLKRGDATRISWARQAAQPARCGGLCALRA